MVRKLFVLVVLISICLSHAGYSQNKEREKAIVSGKIDTLLTPEIGGIRQAIHIKSDDTGRPVLLFLSGGPGSSMMEYAASFTNVLINKFTIVQWDQRDAGKTLAMNPSPVPPTVEQMGKDTYHVIEFLRRKLNQEKIYLLGSSWGNVLGFYIVENHPELLYSYFAVNPVINQLESEKELLFVLKNHFKDNSTASDELTRVKIPFNNNEDLFYLRKWLFYKEGKDFATSSEFKNFFFQWLETWSPVWDEVMKINLPVTLQKVKCPVYFLVGKNDIQTSTKITTEYFELLKAPKKGLFLFENSAHQLHQEEPEKFQNTIIEVVEKKLKL